MKDRNNHSSSAPNSDSKPFSELHSRFAKFAIDTQSDGAFWCDKAGRVIYANQAACESLGYTEAELLSLRLHDFAPTVTEESWPAVFGMVAKMKKVTFESSHKHRDGTIFPVEIAANIIEYENEEYCCAYARDITERKSAEKVLELTKFSLDNAADAVFWIRPDAGFMYVNHSACRMLGYSREELLSKSVYDVDPRMETDEWREQWKALLRDNKRTFEVEHRRKDGSTVPMEVSTNLLRYGDTELACVFGRDISEPRAAEMALIKEHAFTESLIEIAPVIVLVLDRNGCILRYNSHMEKICGYPLEEVVGKPWTDTFVPGAQKEHVNAILSKGMNDRPNQGVDYSILTRKSELREILWFDKPLQDPDGENIGLLAIGQDITERRVMEFRLKQKEKMEAIGQLAGGIAHDFNNQLAGILGFADILQEELTANPVHSRYVENIILAIKRSSDLTNQLLAFSRKGKFLTKPVDIHSLVKEVVDILQRSIDKRITLKTVLDAPYSITVGDPSQLQNAILNLALNARDAMPNGGVITFHTALVELDNAYCESHPYDITPGDYVLLSVSDDGVGMDRDVQQRMFEPFFTTKPKGKGTGMGLAAVYGTMKNHRGAINVYSEPRVGTVVKIFLPVDPNGLEGEERSAFRKSRISSSAQVLLIEDETVLREVAKDLLERIGCQVTVCKNGKEAVALYEKSWRSFDIVILDMVMPEMNGRDAFLAMKRINPEIQAILSSGYSLNGEAQSIIDAGVKDFIQKPFRRVELAEKIDAILQGE